MSPPEPLTPADDAALLIAELQAQGVVDSDGLFTLDRDQARRKLQLFQLENPARFVLELVQAAVLKGASRLFFSRRFAELHLHFDGDPFTLADFEHLYGALFLRASEPHAKARRHLALGLCTAMALSTAQVRMESGSAKDGAFLELRPGAPDRFGPHARSFSPSSIYMTYICIRYRMRLQLLTRFLTARRGQSPEEVLLRARCTYAPVRIFFDMAPIAYGLVLPELAQKLEFEHEDIRGVLGQVAVADPGADPAVLPKELLQPTELRLIKNGVWVDTQHPEELLPGFQALVDCPSLRQDISHEHVVRDEQHERVVKVVLGAQLSWLAARYGEALTQYQASAEGILKRLRAILKLLLSRPAGASFLHAWAGSLPPESPLAARPYWPPDLAAMDRLLHFPIARSTREQWVSLRQLLTDAAQHPSLAYSPLPFGEPDPVRPLVLHLTEPAEVAMFAALLGRPAEDRTAALTQERRRRANRKAWQSRPWQPTLARESYPSQAPIVGPGLSGAVGVSLLPAPAATGTPTKLAVVASGCLLVEKTLRTPVPELSIVIAGDFTPSSMFDEVLGNQLLSDALTAALAALLPLLQGILAVAVGAEQEPAKARTLRGLAMVLLSSSVQKEVRLAAGVEKELVAKAPPLAIAAPALWESLRDVALFQQLDSPALVSIRQATEVARVHGSVAVLALKSSQGATAGDPREAYRRQLHGFSESQWRAAHARAATHARQPARPSLILFIPDDEKELGASLREYLGARYADMHEWIQELHDKLPAPAEVAPAPLPAGLDEVLGATAAAPPRKLQNDCWAWVEFAGGAGHLGLLALPARPRALHRLTLDLYRGETVVGQLQLPLPTGDLLTASLDLGRLRTYAEPELAVKAMAALGSALPQLVRAVLRGNTLPPDERLWLLRLAAALFPTLLFRRAYEQLRQQSAAAPTGPAAAEQQYLQLLTLAATYPVPAVHAALEEALAPIGEVAQPSVSAAPSPTLSVPQLAAQLAQTCRREALRSVDSDAGSAAAGETWGAASLAWVELLYPSSRELPAGQRVRRPLHELGVAPLLNAENGRPLSLLTVLADLDRDGEVLYTIPTGDDPPPGNLDRRVLCIPDAATLEALRCLLGERSLRLAVKPPVVATVEPPAPSRASHQRPQPPNLPAPGAPSPPAAPLQAQEAQELWELVGAELLQLGQGSSRLLSYLNIACVKLEPSRHSASVLCDAQQLQLNLAHPMIQYAAAHFRAEPALRFFIASAVYTAVNHWLGESTDLYHAEFHQLLGSRAHDVMLHGDAAPLANSADSPAPAELLDSPELPELIELAELTDPPELTELPAPAELSAPPDATPDPPAK
ncbi:MAG TPA: hypothetical protein PLW65_21550 [Pseudomonadota bacterium]|nr:hypothetical protein [Pseudomonadota bacterium]